MSIATFADLAAAPNSQKDFLCILNPRKRLQNWTKTGGQTNVYEITFASNIEVSTEFGNTYRQVTSVEHNGTALAVQTSVGNVDSNSGSYYHDISASKLYVHLTDSTSPNFTSKYMIVFVNFYFSSGIGKNGKGKIFDNIYHEPLFSPGNLPDITYEQTDFFAGSGLKTGSINLEFNNTHNFFNIIWKDYAWKNASVNLYYGGEDLPFSEYKLIYNGTITKESWTENKVWFNTTNYINLLKRIIPVTPMFGANVAPEDSGKPIPLAFGTLTGITPLLTDDSDSANKEYTIADAAFQTLKAIDVVCDGTTDVTANVTKDLANCKFTFSSYTPSGEVTCDIQGAKISDITGESSADLMTNASDIIKFFLYEILGLVASDLDTSSFAAAKITNTDDLCKYIRYRRNLSSYITEVERSVLGKFYNDNSGNFVFDIYTPSGAEDDSIINEEIEYFKENSPIAKIFTGVKIYYNPKPFIRYETMLQGEEDSYEVLEGANDKARYIDKQKTSYLHIYTWITGATEAQLHLDRILLLTDQTYIEAEALVNGIKLFERKPGDILKISKNKAPSPTGNYSNAGFQIVKITKGITQQETSLLLDNFKGLTLYVGFWTDDNAPNYTTATEEEKNLSGFWTDGDGLADPSDLDSYNKSIWW